MEKRIGVVAVIITDKNSVSRINSILSEYDSIIMGRMGLPFRTKNIRVVSLIVEGSTDQIGALAGKIGKIAGVQVRSVLSKYKENDNESKENERL
ncbi:MAG TPA: iron-only hydrogenase system regulator [Spirochaetota bacterium]|nr:iron-only hydrogenase system regulator [Spirochaetota bacterium]HOS33813.1 iron-only hydrogenase system regulator [Spirochaetota bacterium]HOS56588.1 iron-only hydrogenase system regulator [Spirochaetota bacterium]HQF78878.1 iron-only hydrogenase system regulator [Spirochaetota bacterium]HQH31159.1 iron-only hydrogenase system regulator [Spirochaetota bacterium]